VLLLLLVGGALARAGGDAEEGAGELWRFTDGEHERVIDVRAMPPYVRRALVERLAAQGFTRRAAEAPDRPGRDLEADVRKLVRHQGRFPTGAEAADPSRSALRSASRPSLLARTLRALGALAARRDPPSAPPARLLGARLGGGADGAWRLISVGPETVAAAAGLRPGDEVVALDGRPPDAQGLARWATAPSEGGKLSLWVRRREGRTATDDRYTLLFLFLFQFEFEVRRAPAPAPVSASAPVGE
jgi:hypothetical protein